MEGLILHEDHISDFKTADEVLNRWAQVTTTGPHILHKSDIVRVDPERLRQPPIIELNALILEKFVVIRFVKDLYAEHDKSGIVPAGQADVVEVVEARAELRTDEWVGGWVKLASHTVWLEAIYTCRHIVNIIAPTRHNRVSLD